MAVSFPLSPRHAHFSTGSQSLCDIERVSTGFQERTTIFLLRNFLLSSKHRSDNPLVHRRLRNPGACDGPSVLRLFSRWRKAVFFSTSTALSGITIKRIYATH